jgi:NAD(P)-dependent dehydrogenase (short-subunit alcohol dehydrogenase family)
VNGLTRGTAASLGRDRIRVNTVTPGWVMTERQKQLWVTPEAEREIDRNQCLPDRLQPEDIAAMVLFLASDGARMCTAQEFIVDGGCARASAVAIASRGPALPQPARQRAARFL